VPNTPAAEWFHRLSAEERRNEMSACERRSARLTRPGYSEAVGANDANGTSKA
jgi:hypothetical protein